MAFSGNAVIQIIIISRHCSHAPIEGKSLVGQVFDVIECVCVCVYVCVCVKTRSMLG